MRAIFIDAVNRKVEEIQIKNELHAFYDKIGCTMIQCVDIGRNHTLVVDEEGKLNPWKVGFQWVGTGTEGIAGNALIFRTTPDGDFASAKVSVEQVSRNLEFLDLTKTPLPPPAIGIAALPDLNPETIARAKLEAMRDLERQKKAMEQKQ